MKSETIAKLAGALSKAQSEFQAVKFDTKNPFLEYRYATLGALLESCKPVLAKHGLSVSQFPVGDGNMIGVETILMHESGEFVSNTVSLPIEKGKGLSTAQSAGVVITYLRRYSLAAALGLYADEDGDGQTQEVKESPKEPKERVFSIDIMEAVISAGVGASNHEEAMQILKLSVLPEDVGEKTVKSWLKHYVESGADTMEGCAQAANNAYLKAKKVGK